MDNYSIVYGRFIKFVEQMNKLLKYWGLNILEEKEWKDEVRKHFIDSPIEFNPDNPKPLLIGISKRHIDVSEQLLNMGSQALPQDFHLNGQNAIQLAILNNCPHILSLLIHMFKSSKLNISNFDTTSTLITYASNSLSLDIFQTFLNVNYKYI